MKRNLLITLLLVVCLFPLNSCEKKCKHEHVIVHYGIEATCLNDGRTEQIVCPDCGEIISSSETIKATGHIKGELKEICLEANNEVNNPGVFKCDKCQSDFVSEITPADINMPIISITGSLENIDSEEKRKVSVTYTDLDKCVFDCDATLKIQGGYTRRLDKKNYNMVLYKQGSNYKDKNKVQVKDNWSKYSKYTLKANYSDTIQAHNVVGAQIYGDIVHSLNKKDEFDKLINGGSIDGFPVVVFNNGVFHGLYSFNNAKDDKLFDMNDDEGSRHAFISTDLGNESTTFYKPMPKNYSEGWELEYCSTEDNKEIGTSWVADSFTNMMDFVINNDGDDFIKGIDKYLDVDHSIDLMLFFIFAKAEDNTSNNMMYVTYDGVKWTPTAYDLDGSFGLDCSGYVTSANGFTTYTFNNLWIKIYENFEQRVINRYKDLREKVLNVNHIDARFTNYLLNINQVVYDTELIKWPSIAPVYKNNLTNVVDFMIGRQDVMDEVFKVNITNDNPLKVTYSESENYTIKAYINEDYSIRGDITNHSYVRDGKTGLFNNNGDGEVNFEVVLKDGYQIESITVNGSYKLIENVKGNIYKISGISSDLSVIVKTK